MITKTGFWTAAALAAGLAMPVAAQDDAPSADTVVAVVNDTEITIGHMIAMRERLPQRFQSLPPETLFGAVLDQLVEQTALVDSMTGDLDRRERLMLENQRRNFLATLVLEDATEAAASEEAVQAAYEERYASAEPEEEYNAAHILVETEEEARAIADELAGGADFAALAQEHSLDNTAQSGGTLGWFGLGMMVEPFEEAVTGLEEGEVSEPFQTQFGWHIVRLNETRMSEAPPLEEVRQQIVESLREEAAQARIDAATGGAEIERMADGIAPGIIVDGAVLDE